MDVLLSTVYNSEMIFRFSLRTTLTCLALVGLMFRASAWQADRHTKKIAEIALLESRLKQVPEPLLKYALNSATDWNNLTHRRLATECRYDYEHEMILRNRRFEEKPGAFVITPCLIKGSQNAVLVNRGFVSFAFMGHEERKRLNRPAEASFVGLVKEDMQRKMFSPKDPPAGNGNPWIDAWLRINSKEIQAQIPYPLIPIYLEIIPDDAPLVVDERFVQSKSGRDDMFMITGDSSEKVKARETVLDPRYPIAVFDTIIPPGRHLGYIYEWAAMGILTLVIGAILQMRRTIKVQ